MKYKIDTIIFDLGGVLVDWNPEYVYKKIFKGDMKKVKWFLNHVCTYEWNLQQDAGRTIEEAVKIKVSEYPEYEDLIQLYYNQWHEMFSGPIQKNVNLFKKFKTAGFYNVYALTNWSAQKWPKALELFPFLNDFDGVVVSGQEKTIKPHPKIYSIIINRFNLTPEKTLFIDDNLHNIEAANAFNFNTIHFKNTTQLQNEIALFGIKI